MATLENRIAKLEAHEEALKLVIADLVRIKWMMGVNVALLLALFALILFHQLQRWFS